MIILLPRIRPIRVLKALILLTITLPVIIPSWINYLDRGEESISIDDLIKGNKKLKSLNLKITGRPLFEFSCKFEDYNKDGRLYDVLYYVPLVPEGWTKDQEIK